MSEEYSDEQARENFAEVKAWWTEFKGTMEYNRLTETERNEGMSVVSAFADFMYSYEGEMPKQWTDNSLWNVCTDFMPRKVMGDEGFFSAISPVLTAFFEFLGKMGYQGNAKRLANRAKSLGNAIVQASKNQSNWGMGKSFLSQAKGSGVDISDQEQLMQFIAAYNESLTSDLLSRAEPSRNHGKVGRNDPCPCGSGQKFKKCCSGHLSVVKGNGLTGAAGLNGG